MILLSFDTEEFDVPREHGVDFPLDKAMEVSVYGTNKILDCLKKNGVRATFFCTSNFAENAPEVMHRIMDEGHEVAAHGCDHWQPQASDVSRSKEILERLTGRKIEGYRQPHNTPRLQRTLRFIKNTGNRGTHIRFRTGGTTGDRLTQLFKIQLAR